MTLICMAHKAEAQSFLNSDMGFEEIEKHFFFSKKTSTYLLITGEGILEVLVKLSFIMGRFDIRSIINLGIAGSLSLDIPLKTIHEVSTTLSFGQVERRKETYNTDSKNPTGQVVCMTTDQCVLDDSFAKMLSPFASIVDREAWAIARVSKIYKKPFYCFKYISDMAGTQSKCVDFKKLAKEYSDALYKFYRENSCLK